MKLERGGMKVSDRKAFKNALQVGQRGLGRFQAQAWPRKRGTPKTDAQLEATRMFQLACEYIRLMDPEEQRYAIENSPGKPYMARDIQMAAIYGVLTEFVTTDGNIMKGRRVLSNEVQALLNRISETPGDMLIRTATDWVALSPGDLDNVFASAGPGNIPYWRDISELLPTVQDQLDTITTDEGALIYRSATAWTEIAAGAADQVLTFTGSSTAPIWQTPSVAPTWAFDSEFHTSGTIVSLATIAAGHILANGATIAAEPTDTALSTLLDVNVGTAIGNILMRGPSGWQSVPAGTDGQVLITHGTTAVADWETPAAPVHITTSSSLLGQSVDPYTGGGTLTLSTTLVAGAGISISNGNTVTNTGSIGVMGVCEVFLTSNTGTISNATFHDIAWGTIYSDPLGCWSAAAPTLITVPTGATQCRLTVSINQSNNATSRTHYMVGILKRSGVDHYIIGDTRTSPNEGAFSATSQWRACSPGDTIRVATSCSLNNYILQGNADPTAVFYGATSAQVEFR